MLNITLRLPFVHVVHAIVRSNKMGWYALVENKGEYVSYAIDVEGNCYHGNYMLKSSMKYVDALRELMFRVM